ncbi:DUF1835 domain-containing protein [Marinobacter xestospongiae]|uniref:DUF1835 domain-containing protein n=1 Tax=Marinobacter xestospongiae TaxID=994319 RepID=A0ABU3VUD5_9GAMM|nr:DUF1835 domain-containing protein [Marinobacter xestospongiae]MDV2077883.1 DUF1835 domain-containing protein [Marinobacter xestospongiae]
MALDDDDRTLHIRCGSDIRLTLEAAGFRGDFLEYADPVCQGPVLDGDDALEARARFISNAYEQGDDQALAATRALLMEFEQHLARASQDYQRVVLWFEHDSYDQLLLCRVLDRLQRNGVPDRLELVSTDHYPGIERFIGLGQLDSKALTELWQRRTAVTKAQLQLGERTWHALMQPDPGALAALVTAPDTAHLPYLAGALLRHLQELPGLHDGLSLTERLTLQPLHSGDQSLGDLFRIQMMETEPRPWLGDAMFWHIVRCLLKAPQPPLALVAGSSHSNWHQRVVTLTELGGALLRRRQDWMECQPPRRWLGGIELGPGRPDWRWDDLKQAPALKA